MVPGRAILTLGQCFGKVIGNNDGGRGKEGMIEPVRVFEVSHFMSFREEREGGGRGKERRGKGGREGEGEEREGGRRGKERIRGRGEGI